MGRRLTAAVGPGPGWLRDREWSGAGFRFRELAAADAEPVRRWRNAQTAVLRQNDPIDADQQRRWFEDVVVPTHASPAPAFLLVAVDGEAGLVAYGGITNASWPNRRGELSFLADDEVAADDDRYRAVFSAFLQWVDGVAFDELGLHRLFAETYAFRTFHLSILEAHGYRLEGRLRDHVVKDGVVHDSLVHGRLASDR